MYVFYLLFAYLVIIMLAVDLFVVAMYHNRRYEKRLEKKRAYWSIVIWRCIKNNNYVLRNYELKKLKKYVCLKAFFKECAEIPSRDFIKLINANEDVIIANIKHIKGRSLRALFAYLVANMQYVDEDTSIKFSEMFLDFLSEKSVYIRENSLRAIIRLGNADYVIKALLKLSLEKIYHNEKLVSDALLMFTGDVEELNNKLLIKLNKFDKDIAIAVIDYWSHTSWHTCDETITRYLSLDDTPIDAICAIVRKLGKNEDMANRKTIIKVVKKFLDLENCEPAIVGVTELGDYINDTEIHELLLHSLKSKNWYVRINSAVALVKNGVTEETLKYIEKCEDPYACDAFEYALKMSGEEAA